MARGFCLLACLPYYFWTVPIEKVRYNIGSILVSCPFHRFFLQFTMKAIQISLPLAFLVLPLFVLGAPSEELGRQEVPTSLSGCKRCCDSLDVPGPSEASLDADRPHALPFVMPEVRPYINITILKGKLLSSVTFWLMLPSHCFLLISSLYLKQIGNPSWQDLVICLFALVNDHVYYCAKYVCIIFPKPITVN